MANRRALSKLLSFAAALPSFLLLLVLGLSSDTVIGHSNVESLPGYNGRLPFELETGYIGVGEDNDVQLFYYFIKSDRNPLEDPVILWTTGGPGCSAFSGLAFEIGPFSFKRAKYDGTLPTLVPNPYSWTEISNIIFLDAPVWTGFSYSRSSRDSYNEDRKSAKQSYDFLRKWLIKHPEFLSNPLYIGGDSYSGLTSPMITLLVSNGNKAGNEPVMNLKGYLLGNPPTDRIIEGNSKIPFAHGMGLISNELYELTKKTCGEDYLNVAPSNRECIKALKAVQECTNGLNDKHILEPLCALTAPKPNEIGQRRRSLNDNSSKFSLLDPPATPELRCRAYDHMLSYYWANDDRVQEALNIRKGIVQEWKRCNRSLNYTKGQSSLNYHIILSNRGYRSLIYSGDHDLIVPFLSTQAWIKSLNYSIVDDWRPWVVNGQVGGYTRTYANNMTFATVKGAGHTTPQYRPAESFATFERWISHDPL